MPGGLIALCQRDPSFCRPAPVAASFLDPSVPQLQLLSSVNEHVNHTIASTTDRALYGRDEYWTIPTTAGDCEDYVLLKRQMLMHLGLPEASLLITVVHDENGEGHAVLTVPTAEGDLVLDNRRDEILRWWETGYSFIKRQSEYDPLNWVSLGEDKLQATEIASGPGLP
jgi:predicted transglutaminase-like cysteine proteinase